MIKIYRFIKPDQQLCYVYGFQLAVIGVIYKLFNEKLYAQDVTVHKGTDENHEMT